MSSIRRSICTCALAALLFTTLFGDVVTTAVGSPSGSPPAAPDPKSPFGVAGAMRWPEWGTFDRPAAALAETGASWDREDFVWGLIEPRQGQFEWTATDRIVENLRARNINILGIISYSANWATPATEDDNQRSAVSFYPPDNSKYYWFVRNLVTRYKGKVNHWEIWNEPNSDLFWKPRPDAHQYADLLKTAYSAVKAGNPDAKVLSGGLAGNAIPFLEEMFAHGAANSFDIFAIHPYAVPVDPAQARQESRPEVHKIVEVELTKYRAYLQRHKLDKPVWVTEVGWPAGDWQLNDQLQADYLAQAYAQILASGLTEKVFWYSFKDEGASGGQSWGLTRWGNGLTDLAPRRPSFGAYATSARMLAGTTPQGRVRIGKAHVIDDFEAAITWGRRVSDHGEFNASAEQHHQGDGSGKFTYHFDAPSQAVDFAPPEPRPLPGKPYEIGLWVRGDASGNYLSAWLRDKDGELLKARFGAVTGVQDGWRYYGVRLNSYYFPWEHTGGNPGNGVADYPLSFVAFRLENTPDAPPGSGTIYVDDLQSIEGPDVSIARFGRPDGQVVDVLWGEPDQKVDLPTRSTNLQIVDRNGQARQFAQNKGYITVQAGSSPTYIVHSPAQTAAMLNLTEAGKSNANAPGPPAACAAMQRVEALKNPNSLYFPETGHNLSGTFRAYWEAHGGVLLLGLPVTEEFMDASSDGKTYRQQYFERARMEYHPENSPPFDVQLGLLGVWTTNGREFPAGKKDGASIFFPESGHGLRLFHEWWDRQGGLPVFGYPLSEEMQEKNAADGKNYTVQYFERNRLEHHPENKGTDHEVLLGLLGVEYLAKQGCK